MVNKAVAILTLVKPVPVEIVEFKAKIDYRWYLGLSTLFIPDQIEHFT